MKRTPLGKGKSSLKRTPLNQGSSTLSRGSKPLQSNSSLKTKSNLNQNSKLKNKPKPKTEAEVNCRKLVKQRSEGYCEICGAQATDMAHRIGVGQSGKWESSNLLHACRKCHSYNHENPENAYAHGWHLKSFMNSLEEPVLLYKNGTKQWFKLDNLGNEIAVNFEA